MSPGRTLFLLSILLSLSAHISVLALEGPFKNEKFYPDKGIFKARIISSARVLKPQKARVQPENPKPKPEHPKKDSIVSTDEKLEPEPLEQIPDELSGTGEPGESKAEFSSDYLSLIVSRIQRQKRYPLGARRRGIEGEVKVKFSIDRRGNLIGIELERSSGFEILDEEALSMVRRASPFPAPPERTLELHIRILFRLKG
jgi:protein TonB